MVSTRGSRLSGAETISRAGAWLGCVLSLAVVCGSSAAGNPEQAAQGDADVETLIAAGVKPDAAGLGAYLKHFLPSESHSDRVAQLIKDLGAAEF